MPPEQIAKDGLDPQLVALLNTLQNLAMSGAAQDFIRNMGAAKLAAVELEQQKAAQAHAALLDNQQRSWARTEKLDQIGYRIIAMWTVSLLVLVAGLVTLIYFRILDREGAGQIGLIGAALLTVVMGRINAPKKD